MSRRAVQFRGTKFIHHVARHDALVHLVLFPARVWVNAPVPIGHGVINYKLKCIRVMKHIHQLAAAKLAHERGDHTLVATALVHEAWLKLGTDSFTSRSRFFRAAAEAMRRILVDHARARKAEKRGGDGQRFEISENDRVYSADLDTILAVNEAMERLAIVSVTRL